ncbi:hypothetical protein CBL_01775, partial [Carabus blaptoides fortunei]
TVGCLELAIIHEDSSVSDLPNQPDSDRYENEHGAAQHLRIPSLGLSMRTPSQRRRRQNYFHSSLYIPSVTAFILLYNAGHHIFPTKFTTDRVLPNVVAYPILAG